MMTVRIVQRHSAVKKLLLFCSGCNATSPNLHFLFPNFHHHHHHHHHNHNHDNDHRHRHDEIGGSSMTCKPGFIQSPSDSTVRLLLGNSHDDDDDDDDGNDNDQCDDDFT